MGIGMGLVLMSERELQWIEVLAQVMTQRDPSLAYLTPVRPSDYTLT